MEKKIVTIKKNIEHPLEEVFDIEPGTTLVTRQEQQTQLVEVEGYDSKDVEIEKAMQEVYDKALSGYGKIQDECEDIEGRYLPRMMEVGVQHLKMALDAAVAKAKVKSLKDNIAVKKASTGPKTVNNTLIINREELMKQLGDDEPESTP
jgi:hypothetical protein